VTYLLDTNGVSDLVQRRRVIAWLPVPSFEAKYFSGLPDFPEAGGARSWKKPAASSWMRSPANLSRSGQATFMLPLSWPASGVVSRWTKTTTGWLRRRSPSGTLVSRDVDFGGIDGRALVALR
jgi:hypothetical protein